MRPEALGLFCPAAGLHFFSTIGGSRLTQKKSSQIFFSGSHPQKKTWLFTFISFIGPVLGSPKWSSFSQFRHPHRGHPKLLIVPSCPVVVGSSLISSGPSPVSSPPKKACSATNVPQIFSKVPPSRGSPLSPASYPECSKNYVAGLRFSRVLFFPSKIPGPGVARFFFFSVPVLTWSFIILYRSPGAKKGCCGPAGFALL